MSPAYRCRLHAEALEPRGSVPLLSFALQNGQKTAVHAMISPGSDPLRTLFDNGAYLLRSGPAKSWIIGLLLLPPQESLPSNSRNTRSNTLSDLCRFRGLSSPTPNAASYIPDPTAGTLARSSGLSSFPQVPLYGCTLSTRLPSRSTG